MQEIWEPFYDLAHSVAGRSGNQETTVFLRKLLEARDAAIRALGEG